jgi:uncharacterized protein YhfF
MALTDRLNPPAALDSIAGLVRRFADRLLIVTQHADSAIVRAAKAVGLLAMPGFFTPGEAFAFLTAGADALKLFPAEAASPAMLKAVLAVFPPGTALLIICRGSGATERRALESFSFGDSPALADELAELVLAGLKRATCWAASEGLLTQIGKRMVMLDGSGQPLAILETVELVQRRFSEVDAAFAYDEGEGDRSLAFWQRAHREYFGRRGQFTEDMLLYCVRFRVVERIAADDGRPAAGAR